MKKTAAKLLVMATAFLLLPIALRAHEDPHMTEAFSCLCHNPHKKLDAVGYYANLCISCHRPGMIDKASIVRAGINGTTPNYKYIKPFSYGDQANPFENDPGLNKAPNKVQNSHKWSGSDTVPEAGALPPTNPLMNPIMPNVPSSSQEEWMLMGSLTCYRCHSISLPRAQAGVNSAPFLRGLTDNDDICFDCHRSRNTANVFDGTHPVNVLYSSATSKTRVKPNEYYPRPVNANPANPTSQLKMKSGKIVCMTCHGVHFTDSNSFTFDKYSSIIAGQYSTSKGYLLKTDYRRGSVSERNICMNCHRSNDLAENNGRAAVKNHNGSKKQQNIQCTDCHGGHVAFPGYSSAKYGRITQADLTPNIYLINRFMNITANDGRFKSIRNAKVLFNDVNNKNAKGTYGVCVACHSTLPSSVSQHSGANDWNVCKTCHTHQMGFSADCTSCHGFPPSDNIPGGPIGYAATPYNYSQSSSYKDEAATPHMMHAGGGTAYYYFRCDECHKGNTHASGTFNDVFKDRTGTMSSLAVYDPATATCTTVYCHSDGNGDYSKPVPAWNDGKGKIVGQANECRSCHNYPPTSSAHSRHTAGSTSGKAYNCSMCHAQTVDATADSLTVPAIKDRTKHVNTNKDVVFSGLGTSANFNNSTKECTNVYCHSDGRGGAPITTPAFNNLNSGKCGACHANPMTNFGHPAHLSAVYGPKFSSDPLLGCAVCHAYNGEFGVQHVNGTVDVTYSSCYTCHPGGMGQTTWTAGNVTCESCHVPTGGARSVFMNITAPDKSRASISGHNKASGANKTCLDCHVRNGQHLDSNPKVHAFRLLTTLSSAVNQNKACTFCHNDITKVNNNARFANMSTHFTAKGSGQTMQCWQCHELHGTTNNSMIKSKIAYANSTTWTITFLNRSTAMIDKVTNRGLCQVCHTKTNHYRAGASWDDGHPDKNCFDCHKHNSPGGAFKGSGCNGCHGYPPVPKSAKKGIEDPLNYKGTFGTDNNYISAAFEDYSGGGGVHLWHVPQSAKQSDGWLHCAKCHSGGSTTPSTHKAKTPLKNNISNVTVQIDNRYRFSDVTFPSYSGAKLVDPPAVNNTGSCVNVMCHFQPTPRWSKDR